MIGKRKDANHTAIVAALERCGAYCIDMTGDPKIGFDLIVVFRGMKEIVEIKDGAKCKSAKALTKREYDRKLEVERRGVPYRVIESVDEALRLIGAIR